MINTLSYTARAKDCRVPVAKALLQLLDEKKTNLAVAADVTSAHALIELAEKLGPHICLLKTHIDIIHDFTPALTEKLQQLAKQHDFFIFEDRKFADIGNTVKEQYAGGIYHIADWAHFTNAHTLPGPGIIEGLRAGAKGHERGLILLAEMSSSGHLMDEDYQAKTLEMAKAYDDFVMGFITQHALPNATHFIHLTPGIQFTTGTDDLKQQYTSPRTAILSNGSDIIIVGRGIIAAMDPCAEAKLYREAGWEAYCERVRGGR